MTSLNHTDNSRKSDRLIRRRLPRRDESGLTTLEWLLIVAAVAGLAALAVVLVTNVVGETSEQISGSSARLVAAETAAADVERRARADTPTGTSAAEITASVNELNAKYGAQCDQIKIPYAAALEDAGKNVSWTGGASGTAGSWATTNPACSIA